MAYAMKKIFQGCKYLHLLLSDIAARFFYAVFNVIENKYMFTQG